MRYGRENIDRKIADLQRMLATADDQLEIALLKLAIESLEAERNGLFPADDRQITEEARTGVRT